MREIHGHEVNECNEQLRITADERNPQNGNASHSYAISIGGGPRSWFLCFQNGPIKEVGVNGITQEALLAILIDRLQCFQSSQWACEENELALAHLGSAQEALLSRTRKRLERGVEGTNAV